jgi:hypothetical protein
MVMPNFSSNLFDPKPSNSKVKTVTAQWSMRVVAFILSQPVFKHGTDY